jgi:cell division protein FtsL
LPLISISETGYIPAPHPDKHGKPISAARRVRNRRPVVRLRFSRLSLLTKILLSTTVAITILFAITGQIVLHNITRTMSDSLQHEVQDSFRAYTSLWKAKADLLSSVSRIMSDMSDVRAAVQHRRPRHHPGQPGRIVAQSLR